MTKTDSERLDAVISLGLQVFESDGVWVVRCGGAVPCRRADNAQTFREAIDHAVSVLTDAAK